MSTRKRTTTHFCAGLLLALVAGAPPALADDTELMLLVPEVEFRPNILFMLDTSGSMDDEVQTKEPFNPATTYSGACDPNAVYWTDVDLTPSCTTDQYVLDDAFKCAAAAGPLMGVGSYTDTMVQYRETADPDVVRWQSLEAGNADDLVECMKDSGEHGSGVAGEVYATNDPGTAFTDDESRELAWGSAPATVTYTVYDGNYLNWKSSATLTAVRKIDILKAVTTSVLNTISDVNVGIMRFNNNNGGVVIKAMSDLDGERDSILATVAGLPAQGNTPLAEVMYEGALYWRGEPPHFGLNHTATDPDSLAADGDYLAPETQVCSKNFNILLSDGQPQDDNDEAETLAGTLPGFSGCDGTGTGACLDDIAEHLATVDIDGDASNDEQLVTTHTIGFAMDIPNLQETARDSGGQYFRADDVETLTNALLQIFSDINTNSLSFTAPAVSVNSFNRTQNLNDLYITVFQAESKVHWPGNLKKYKIAAGQIVDANDQPAVQGGFFRDDALSIWTDGGADGRDVTAGGAAHEFPATRILLTEDGSGPLVPVDDTNVSGADLGLTGAAGEPTLAELLSWMHGQDVRDEDLDGDRSEARNAMGDPLHSQPAAVVYGGAESAPDVTVFVGTNDGYLHAIDGDTGTELWAFLPTEMLDDMKRLYFDPASNFKHYGIDGSIVPVAFDEDNDGIIESSDGDFVYIIFGLRRGGSSYYALDVTDRAAPELLWAKQYPEFGQTWSTPTIARIDTDDTDNTDVNIRIRDAVVIVGGGYDPVHDTPAAPTSPDALGAGIHVLDLYTGERIWWAGPASSGANLELAEMTRSFPSQIRAIDLGGDGFADRMYAVDVGGRIWRFDIANGASADNLVRGGVIADLGTPGVDESASIPRRFYAAPDVAIFTDPSQGQRFISINIGSGYRAHPLNDSANDMFFSVRDPAVFNALTQPAYDAYDVVTVDDLATATLDAPATIGPLDRGWKLPLPSEQSVFDDSLTFNGSTLFVAFAPGINSSDPCQPTAGFNFAYMVSVLNGDFAENNMDSPIDDDATPYVEIPQGGIVPGGTLIFEAPAADCEGEACSPPPVVRCLGTTCFRDDDPINLHRTLWTQDGIE